MTRLDEHPIAAGQARRRKVSALLELSVENPTSGVSVQMLRREGLCFLVWGCEKKMMELAGAL